MQPCHCYLLMFDVVWGQGYKSLTSEIMKPLMWSKTAPRVWIWVLKVEFGAKRSHSIFHLYFPSLSYYHKAPLLFPYIPSLNPTISYHFPSFISLINSQFPKQSSDCLHILNFTWLKYIFFTYITCSHLSLSLKLHFPITSPPLYHLLKLLKLPNPTFLKYSQVTVMAF